LWFRGTAPLAFVGGLGLLIGSSVAGYGVGVVIAGVLFAAGFARSRPTTWFGYGATDAYLASTMGSRSGGLRSTSTTR